MMFHDIPDSVLLVSSMVIMLLMFFAEDVFLLEGLTPFSFQMVQRSLVIQAGCIKL